MTSSKHESHVDDATLGTVEPRLEEGWPQMPLDHPREECGVFGVYAPGEDVARLTFFGLYALQHRGQESAGIATADGHDILSHTRMGLVNTAFS